jgi:hypothetical protein
MLLSCVLHHVTAELSDGFTHVFHVQRKAGGLVLTSHTLRSAAGRLQAQRVAPERENARSNGGSRAMRVMSFNIWNYNGNWKARVAMIADVIEASGAGGGGWVGWQRAMRRGRRLRWCVV